MGAPDWSTEDSCRRAVKGKFQEEPIVKGLKNQAKLIQLDSVSNGKPEPTLAFVGPTKGYTWSSTYQMSKYYVKVIKQANKL